MSLHTLNRTAWVVFCCSSLWAQRCDHCGDCVHSCVLQLPDKPEFENIFDSPRVSMETNFDFKWYFSFRTLFFRVLAHALKYVLQKNIVYHHHTSAAWQCQFTTIFHIFTCSLDDYIELQHSFTLGVRQWRRIFENGKVQADADGEWHSVVVDGACPQSVLQGYRTTSCSWQGSACVSVRCWNAANRHLLMWFGSVMIHFFISTDSCSCQIWNPTQIATVFAKALTLKRWVSRERPKLPNEICEQKTQC